MANYGKVELPAGRHDWQPVPLPEQVVLVTTVDSEDQPHVATKTRLSVISYGPPTILVFACRAEYTTAANLRTSGQFVVNVPGDNLVATSWIVGLDPGTRGPKLFEENGLTPIPSLKVRPPRIAECRAHIECVISEMPQFGDELAAFGEVVSVTVNSDLAEESDRSISYKKLAPFFFLEAGWTSPLGRARQVDQPVPGPRHDLTVLAVADLGRAHEFYAQAFQWPLKRETRNYIEFELPGGRGLALTTRETFRSMSGILPPEIPEHGVSAVQLYLHCDDLPGAIARLHLAKARLLSEIKPRQWGDEAAYFADPDGHVIVVARPLMTDPG